MWRGGARAATKKNMLLGSTRAPLTPPPPCVSGRRPLGRLADQGGLLPRGGQAPGRGGAGGAVPAHERAAHPAGRGGWVGGKKRGGGTGGGRGARPRGGGGRGGGGGVAVRLPASSACVCRPPCSALPPPGVTGRPPRRCTERETGGERRERKRERTGRGAACAACVCVRETREGGRCARRSRTPHLWLTPLPSLLSLRPHRSAPGGGRAAGAVAPRACAIRPRTASPCAQPTSTGPCAAGLPRYTGTRTTGGGWSRSVRAWAGRGGGGA